MLKKIMGMALIVVTLFGVLSLSGCNNKPQTINIYVNNNDTEHNTDIICMNAGETKVVDRSTFSDLENWNMADYDSLELSSHQNSREGVVTIKDNIITAVNSGYTAIVVSFYKKGRENGKKVIYRLERVLAEIYVINEATMTPITTAQELADMNNDLDGHYILKDDIDLSDWGDWWAIGIPAYNSASGFCGMFVNPYGYKIKNLTATTSKTSTGLFDSLNGYALISGVILENVSIDVSDYDSIDPILGFPALDPVGSPTIGALASHNQAKILNCVVSGIIIGGGVSTGGLVGSNTGYILNCKFTGKINNHNLIPSYDCGVGGIAGYNNSDSYKGEIIKNCTINADINGGTSASAGGIIGYNLGIKMPNNIFTGTVISERLTYMQTMTQAGTMIGLNVFSDASPICFE